MQHVCIALYSGAWSGVRYGIMPKSEYTEFYLRKTHFN